MDKDLQRKIAEARQEGYSDEEIAIFLRQQGLSMTGETVPVQMTAPVQPSPTTTGGPSMAEVGMMAFPAAEALGTGALYGAGAYGAYKALPKIQQGMEMAKNYFSPNPANQVARPAGNMQAPTGQGRSIPIQYPQSSAPAQPPTNISSQPARPMSREAQQFLNQRQATGPVAPQGVSQAKPQPNVMDKASQIVRQLALDKLLKASAGTAAMMMPGNIGQEYNFPTTGPMRGMEINPNTGMPWTPEELKQYRMQYKG